MGDGTGQEEGVREDVWMSGGGVGVNDIHRSCPMAQHTVILMVCGQNDLSSSFHPSVLVMLIIMVQLIRVPT